MAKKKVRKLIPDGYLTEEEVELLIDDYEEMVRRFRDKAMAIEFRMPGLSEDDRAALSKVIRETLIDLAHTRVPGADPDLEKRFERVLKAFLSEEH